MHAKDATSNMDQLVVAAKSNPALLPSSAAALQSAGNSLITSAKAIATVSPPEKQSLLLERSKVLSDAVHRVRTLGHSTALQGRLQTEFAAAISSPSFRSVNRRVQRWPVRETRTVWAKSFRRVMQPWLPCRR